MSPIRRAADGRLEAAPNWESLAERQIREAQERGEFSDLPLHGKPLPRPDDAYAGEMALAYSILRNHGVAPPWIEADKEARRLLDERSLLLSRARDVSPISRRRYRDQLVEIVRSYNRAVEALNAEAPSHRQHRLRVDEGRELVALEAIWTDSDAAEAAEAAATRDTRDSASS